MPRILLVKTSSLGDVVHNLPVASDIVSAIPDAKIDWAVEESFSAIPRLHPSIQRVMPVALRRWRRRWWQRETWRELDAFFSELRLNHYDAVVDTQGLLKSALIARAAKGPRYGLDWRTSREPLFMFYDHTFHVPRTGQAVERNRTLAAQALRYTHPHEVRYGIQAPAAQMAWIGASAYVVLIHSTSARGKLWPEARWIEIGNALHRSGLVSVLPWGNEAERERSARLRRAIRDAIIPPRLDVQQIASVLAQTYAVIGVDTGLTHLAGALGVPTLGIYTGTDPRLTGLYGCARAANLGGVAQAPSSERVLSELERLHT